MVFAFMNVSSGTGDEMEKANLTSQVDGETTGFTTPEYEAGTIRVYYNGVRQVLNEHFYETNSTTITLLFTPLSGDYLTIDYIPPS